MQRSFVSNNSIYLNIAIGAVGRLYHRLNRKSLQSRLRQSKYLISGLRDENESRYFDFEA